MKVVPNAVLVHQFPFLILGDLGMRLRFRVSEYALLTYFSGHLPKAHRRGRGLGEGVRGRRRGMGRGAGDLKTKTEILKKRRLKEFQDARRKLKAKKRKTTGGQKGKTPRTGTRQR